MDYFKAFPKIFALGHRSISTIFHEEVEITEKGDGSQFAFCRVGDDLHCRSKGCIQHVEAPDKLFEEGVEYLKSIKDRIPEGYIFYAEYLRKPKHNSLVYERIPRNHFALFGVYHVENQVFVGNYDTLLTMAHIMDIEPIPLLFKGKIEAPEEIEGIMNSISVLGGCRIEGVVVKNYKDNFVGGVLFPVMSGKYVSERFKEIHRKNWKKENTNKGKWEVFKSQYNTPARWEKAIIHLKERSELEGSPRDIGKLMKEVQVDVSEECKEEICEWLWKHFGKEVVKGAAKGLPEWYKDKLMKDSFLQGEENAESV